MNVLLIIFLLRSISIDINGSENPYWGKGGSLSLDMYEYITGVWSSRFGFSINVYEMPIYQLKDSTFDIYTLLAYSPLDWLRLNGFLELRKNFMFYPDTTFYTTTLFPGVGLKIGSQILNIFSNFNFEIARGELSGYKKESHQRIIFTPLGNEIFLSAKTSYDTKSNEGADSLFLGIDTFSYSFEKFKVYGSLKKGSIRNETPKEVLNSQINTAKLFVFYPFKNAEVTFGTAFNLVGKSFFYKPIYNFTSDSSLFSANLRYFPTNHINFDFDFSRSLIFYTASDTNLSENRNRKYFKGSVYYYLRDLGNISFFRTVEYGEMISPSEKNRTDRKKRTDTTHFILYLNKPKVFETYSNFKIIYNRTFYTEKYPQGISWRRKETYFNNTISFFLKSLRTGAGLDVNASLTEYPGVVYLNNFARYFEDSVGVSSFFKDSILEIGIGFLKEHLENWEVRDARRFEVSRIIKEESYILWGGFYVNNVHISISGREIKREENEEGYKRITNYKNFNFSIWVSFESIFFLGNLQITGRKDEKYIFSNFSLSFNF